MKAFFTGKVVGEVEKLHLKDERFQHCKHITAAK